MKPIKPNFLIIGAPKSGTTSIYHHLRSHPDVFMPNTTELRYFNHKQVLNNVGTPGIEKISSKVCKSWGEYQEYFNSYNGEKAIGECTTNYFFYKESLLNIKNALGTDVKLILVLREPVSRAFSHYQYMVRRGKEELSFEQSLEQENTRRKNKWDEGWRYTDASLYSEHIKHLIELELNFKVFLFEDFKKSPPQFMKDVFSYLGVDPRHNVDNIDLKYNKGGIYKHKSLMTWMMSSSKFRRNLKALLPISALNRLRLARDKFIAKQTKPLVINAKTKTELREYFKDDVKELSSLLDSDLSLWGYEV